MVDLLHTIFFYHLCNDKPPIVELTSFREIITQPWLKPLPPALSHPLIPSQAAFIIPKHTKHRCHVKYILRVWKLFRCSFCLWFFGENMGEISFYVLGYLKTAKLNAKQGWLYLTNKVIMEFYLCAWFHPNYARKRMEYVYALANKLSRQCMCHTSPIYEYVFYVFG